MFLVSKTLARDFWTGLMARSSMRARGFPARPPSPRRAGCCPFRCRFARSGWSSPAAGSGRRQASALPVCNPRHARPAGCAWLRVAWAALDPAPSLKTRLRASQSLVDTFKRPSGATGHRIALGGPSTASRRAFWACMVFTSSASVVSRVGASSPARSAFDALADGSIEPLPERLALSMGGSDRRVSGLGRHPADGPRSRPRPFFGNSRHRLNPFNENNVLSKSGQHRLTRKHTRFGPRR